MATAIRFSKNYVEGLEWYVCNDGDRSTLRFFYDLKVEEACEIMKKHHNLHTL